jgi:hypothetical protein
MKASLRAIIAGRAALGIAAPRRAKPSRVADSHIPGTFWAIVADLIVRVRAILRMRLPLSTIEPCGALFAA